MNSRYLNSALESVLLLVVLLVAVLFTIEPWRAYFTTGLVGHHDAKLMGQWMAWSADKIAQGNVLLPDFNANFFYPHRYTLALGDAFWTPSFIYAALYSLSRNPFLSFNGTMLFFWALSGLTMFALLRELSFTRVVSYAGAFLYCLIPFRLSYYYLLTATLVFAIPLLIFLLIRWLREPTATRVLLLLLGLWISLTSNLNYSVIAFMPVLLLFVAYLGYRPQLLRDKRFWLTGGAAATLVVVVSAFYLHPYVTLRLEGEYVRGTRDHLKHYVEAFHYLSTAFSAFATTMFTPPTRPASPVLFPGTVLAVLSLVFVVVTTARSGQRFASVPRRHAVFLLTKFLLWGAFWGLLVSSLRFYPAPWIESWQWSIYPISVAIVLIYVIAVLWRRDASEGDVIMTGLAAGAVVCFFLSLGPVISFTELAGRGVVVLGAGPMGAALEHVPIFGSVRALDRFAVVVYLYLIVASCHVLELLFRQRRVLVPACLLIPVGLIYEGAWAHERYRYKFADYVDVVNSPVIATAKRLPEQAVLFQLPAGATYRIESTIVMQTIGDFHYLVNGHSGFWPEFSHRISKWSRDWQLEELTAWLKEIWPPVYLVLDRGGVDFTMASWHKPFPQDVLESSWRLLVEDSLYALYELKSREFTANRVTQRLRSDVLDHNRVLSFEARANAGGAAKDFRVRLNSIDIGTYRLTVRWSTYRIELPLDYPSRLSGDEVTLEVIEPVASPSDTSQEGKWTIRALRFSPLE